jgi:hypothetical protein
MVKKNMVDQQRLTGEKTVNMAALIDSEASNVEEDRHQSIQALAAARGDRFPPSKPF